jgi:hypothetical protein
MTTIDPMTIVGYTLFGLSELVAILPIPSNGILHSFIIGLQNSIKKPNNNNNNDLEMAQTLINKQPSIANIINTISYNPNLINSVKLLLDNQHLIPLFENISKDQNLQYVLNIVQNNPKISPETIKKTIEGLSVNEEYLSKEIKDRCPHCM